MKKHCSASRPAPRRRPATAAHRATRAVWRGATLWVALSATAFGQPLYDLGRQAWQDGRYRFAHDTLLEYRALPYGRRPDVDFMLGTSGCRIPERVEWGHGVLDWMLYAYALTYESRSLVRGERDLCRAAAQRVATDIGRIVEERAAGMTGYGKTFYWAERENQPVASYPLRRTRAMAREDMTARLVPLGEPDRALAVAKELSPRGRAAVHGPFLLISEAGHEAGQLASIGQTLSRYLRFLGTSYDVTPPAHFVTVYLVESHYAVRGLAERLHGLDVSEATVGYTFVDDASVVAAVAGTAVGTVLHELFHLLVRADFGDIPQWLDEGIASLYEVSGRNGDNYFGLENWRRKVLEELWDHRPSVADLIRSEWFLFDDPRQVRVVDRRETDIHEFYGRVEGRRQAAMMAMARYFLLQLEQRGELPAVFRAIRDRGLEAPGEGARERALRLVETTLGRTAATLDAEFVYWFESRAAVRVGQARQTLASGGTLYVATANVNIRTGPSTDFEKLGLLPQGRRVAVFDERDGWYEVRFSDGATGFVSGDYLRKVPQP